MPTFSDFFDAEMEQRLAVILDKAVNALTPEDRRQRQRRIAAGEAPADIHVRGGVNPLTGPYLEKDPETGGLIFDWANEVLVIVPSGMLEPGSQPPAKSN